MFVDCFPRGRFAVVGENLLLAMTRKKEQDGRRVALASPFLFKDCHCEAFYAAAISPTILEIASLRSQ
jgi:hypothetical protein